MDWDNKAQLSANLEGKAKTPGATWGCNDSCDSSHQHLLIHRSWRSVLPGLLLFALVSLVAVPISNDFPILLLNFDLSTFGLAYQLSMPILGLISAVLLARPLFLMYDCFHEVRCHHLRTISGRCSLRKNRIEIAFEDLRGVRVQQSILERLLGVGTIMIGTSITDTPEVRLHGIANPAYYANLIMEFMDRTHLKSGKTVD